MANQRLMKKVAPVVLSAAVAMTSMPATAFAADFSDTEVTVAEESADIEETSAEAADTDVVEDTDGTAYAQDAEGFVYQIPKGATTKKGCTIYMYTG